MGLSGIRERLDDLLRRGEFVTLETLCHLGVEYLGLVGMSIALVTEGKPQSALVASDERINRFEDMQFTLGVGPGFEAHTTGRAVVVDDLDSIVGRWPEVVTEARRMAIGGVSVFPVEVGAIKLGVVSLYRSAQDSRDGELTTQGLQVADLVGRLALGLQLEAVGESLSWALRDGLVHRAVVHQATGMAAVQLGSSVEDAFVRLRARAFADGRPVVEVAQDVVERRLRFEREAD